MEKLELQYSLTPEDFLTFQIYASGQSALQKLRRRRGRWIVPLAYGLIAILFFTRHQIAAALIFAAGALLWFLFYPKYAHWYYRRYFKKHIHENYQDKIDYPMKLGITDEGFYSAGCETEGKIKFTAVGELVELPQHFLIRLKPTGTLILPKEKIEAHLLKIFMNEVAQKTGLQVQDHRAQVWK